MTVQSLTLEMSRLLAVPESEVIHKGMLALIEKEMRLAEMEIAGIRERYGDYAYHWERRRQTGHIYRWDNAPHYPLITTYPAHLHDGDESAVTENQLDPKLESALRVVLDFVRQHMV